MPVEARGLQVFVLRVWNERAAARRASVRRADGGEWIDVSTPAALLDYWREIMGTACSPPPPMLRLHVLGPFCALKDEVPPPQGYKAQRRCFDLLRALVALGGRNVDERKLADALWPDNEADLARQNLKATLHRLRRLVGKEAIVLHGGRLSLVPEHCWVDVWAFERHLDDVLARPVAAGVDELSAHLDAALDLYRGPLLPDDDTPLVLVQRERLRNKLLRAIDRTTQALLAAGRFAACAALVERGLDVDPLEERLYETLMRALLADGRRADALRAYDRCARQLCATLDVAPGRAMQGLRQQAHDPVRA